VIADSVPSKTTDILLQVPSSSDQVKDPIGIFNEVELSSIENKETTVDDDNMGH